jgi:hypothetical protein
MVKAGATPPIRERDAVRREAFVAGLCPGMDPGSLLRYGQDDDFISQPDFFSILLS